MRPRLSQEGCTAVPDLSVTGAWDLDAADLVQAKVDTQGGRSRDATRKSWRLQYSDMFRHEHEV